MGAVEKVIDKMTGNTVEETDDFKESNKKPITVKGTGKKKIEANKKKDGPPAPKVKVPSRNELFLQAITKKPLTMKEVKALPWNKTHGTFYSFFKILVAEGKAKKTDEGKMTGC